MFTLFAASLNDLKDSTPCPCLCSVESVKAMLSPCTNVSVSAEAAEMVLCPLVYSGKGGVCKNGCHLGSISELMTVSGRTFLVRYFSSQHPIKPSNKAIDVRVYPSTLLSNEALVLRQTVELIAIQCPPGVIFLLAKDTCPTTFITKGLSSQNQAMRFCSSVRFLPISYTSRVSRQNSLFFSLVHMGGRGGINCVAESSVSALILCHSGSQASAYAGGVGTQVPGSLVTVNRIPRVCL